MDKLKEQVKFTVESSKSLRQKQNERRELRSQQRREATESAKAQQEFQKKLQNATFEFQQRKLAVQALQACIAREIQYLEVTAADLANRVSTTCSREIGIWFGKLCWNVDILGLTMFLL